MSLVKEVRLKNADSTLYLRYDDAQQRDVIVDLVGSYSFVRTLEISLRQSLLLPIDKIPTEDQWDMFAHSQHNDHIGDELNALFENALKVVQLAFISLDKVPRIRLYLGRSTNVFWIDTILD
jgi:hypothetical protein